jgi:predicted ester cyclase
MRTLVSTLTFALLAVACGSTETAAIPPTAAPNAPPPEGPSTPAPSAPAASAAAPPPPASAADRTLAAVQASIDALAAHDAKRLAGVCAEKAVLWSPGSPSVTGRDALAQTFQAAFDAFPDGKWVARRILVKDDVAIFEWTMTGTNTGPMPGGSKPTGKAVGVSGADVLRVGSDGLIVELHEYMDLPTMLGQLGMSKDPTRAPAALPTDAPEVHVAKGSPDEAKNADRAKAVVAAVIKLDRKVLDGAYVDGVTWDDFTAPAPVNGKKTLLEMVDANAKAFSDVKLDCQRWAFEDYVAQECAFKGKNTGTMVLGPTQKIPPTKKSLEMHGLDVVQMKDGKAVKGWSYGNGMELAMQLAQSSAAPAAKADAAKAPATKGGAKDTAKKPNK